MSYVKWTGDCVSDGLDTEGQCNQTMEESISDGFCVELQGDASKEFSEKKVLNVI